MKSIVRLFRPLDYLRIRHPQKTYYDITLPAIVAALATIGIICLPMPLPIFGPGGLLSVITGILQILTAFYIASLAAVATFDKKGLDRPMAGKPIELSITRKGQKKTETLTRRRFLCLMFGYMALMSFFLYFFGSAANLIVENVQHITPQRYQCYLKWGFVAVYLFLTANLVTTTLHGFYYLVDRIHRLDPRIVGSDTEEGK